MAAGLGLLSAQSCLILPQEEPPGEWQEIGEKLDDFILDFDEFIEDLDD